MPSEKTERTAQASFLAVLEAKYAALGKLIESYRAAESLGALGAPGELNISAFDTASTFDIAQPSIELPQGALLGKSLPAAIKLYLSAVKKKQTTREITTALKEGGVESTSDNFENIVTTALNRLKAGGEVLRFKDGWALADFYPESLRNRIAKDSEPKKRGKVKRAAKRATKKAERREPKSAKRKDPTQPGLEQRISSYLQTRGSEYTTVQELVAQLKVAAQVLNLTLGKMSKATKIEKNSDGRIRLTKKAA